MPSKEIRKIIYVGKSSALTLPKAYVDFYELKKDESIVVLYNKVLIIIPEVLYNKIMDQSGDMINQILDPETPCIVLKPQTDLMVWLEKKAKGKGDLTKEQTAIMFLREIMEEDQKEAQK